MALVKCSDGGADVSDAAPACLRCGQPAPVVSTGALLSPAAASASPPGQRAPDNRTALRAIGAVFVFLGGLTGLGLCNQAQERDRAEREAAAHHSAAQLNAAAP